VARGGETPATALVENPEKTTTKKKSAGMNPKPGLIGKRSPYREGTKRLFELSVIVVIPEVQSTGE
jgi:hypothetical protein